MDLPEMAFDDLVVLVKRLGALALEAQEGAVQGLKEDGTSVTVVDGEVEAQLRAFLNQRFPGHRIMGEEGGLTGEAQSRWTWVIDPIDGTTNYAHGLPIWAVSIGLLEGGLPQWGCVFVPRLNQLFVAQRGRGATRNGRPISPLLRHRLEKEDLFGITSDAAKRWEFRMPHKLRAMGSAATQAVLVASGQLAGYFLDEWYIWDIAAALLIAQETGVRVTDLHGEAFISFPRLDAKLGPPLLFAAQSIHAQLLPLIQPKKSEAMETGEA